MKNFTPVVASVIFVLVSAACAAAPSPPKSLEVTDHPNDVGKALDASWRSAKPEFAGQYEIFVKDLGDPKGEDAPAETTYQSVATVAGDVTKHTIEGLKPSRDYRVRVVAIGPDGTESEPVTLAESVAPVANWFNTTRGWLAILLALVCGVVLAYIAAARRGMELWVRPIAGLQAVTDAVGRAVEMGKKVLFVPGIQDINDIQTVAGLTVLSRVSRITAEYDAEMLVPTARSLVMASCRETVGASYLQAGRPDSYNPDDIYYLTDEQFGYVAGVTGAMVREEPAACFYMGAFYAESLILAETGNSIGAIQVAGTAMPSQLPFFIAACDYTLIGEEFFAASAYLSGEPQQLGSLKGQDFGKLLATGLILLGCLLAPWAIRVGERPLAREPASTVPFVEFLSENVLGGGDFWPEDWQ